MEKEIIIKNKFGVEARFEDGELWLNQKEIEKLFNSSHSNVSARIKAIYKDGERDETSTCRFLRHVATNNKCYNIKYYNRDMVISLGFRINSEIAVAFRQWATEVIKIYPNEKGDCNQCKNVIMYLQNEIIQIKDDISNMKQIETILKPGEKIRGLDIIEMLLKFAKNEIVIFDNYFDKKFDDILEKTNVNVTIVTNSKNSYQNSKFNIIKTNEFHDRFLFIDDSCIAIGSSLKDFGTKLTSIIMLKSVKKENIFDSLGILKESTNS